MADLVIEREILIEAPAEVVWRTSERTRLRVSESGHELLAWPDAEKERYADEHRGGWGEFLDRLANVVAKRQPG
jgi:hypothetical protein